HMKHQTVIPKTGLPPVSSIFSHPQSANSLDSPAPCRDNDLSPEVSHDSRAGHAEDRSNCGGDPEGTSTGRRAELMHLCRRPPPESPPQEWLPGRIPVNGSGFYPEPRTPCV